VHASVESYNCQFVASGNEYAVYEEHTLSLATDVVVFDHSNRTEFVEYIQQAILLFLWPTPAFSSCNYVHDSLPRARSALRAMAADTLYFADVEVRQTFVASSRRTGSTTDLLLVQEQPQQTVYEVTFNGDCPQDAKLAFLQVKNYYAALLSVQVQDPESPGTWITVLRNTPIMRNANFEDDAQMFTAIYAHQFLATNADCEHLLSAPHMWKGGLRVIASQPSPMWHEFRLDSVRRHRMAMLCLYSMFTRSHKMISYLPDRSVPATPVFVFGRAHGFPVNAS